MTAVLELERERSDCLVTVILGVLPLATGPGAEMRQALGTAVFSGGLGVTLFGVFLTHLFYVLLRRASPARAASREEGHEREAPALARRDAC